jgi:hypothetical protein
MTDPPAFFIPKCSEEEQEQVYADLATGCSRQPAAAGERIYSICFEHDGETWTATVGQRLSGERIKRLKREGGYKEVRSRLNDGATVLAILAPDPYMVVTDAAPFNRRALTAWENPFMASAPTHVARFID